MKCHDNIQDCSEVEHFTKPFRNQTFHLPYPLFRCFFLKTEEKTPLSMKQPLIAPVTKCSLSVRNVAEESRIRWLVHISRTHRPYECIS